MVDLLVAVSEGETTFDADDFVKPSAERWPTAAWYEPDPDDELAVTMGKQLTVREPDRILIVDFAASRRSIGVEGDDDLAAELLALLTHSTPIPENTVAAMNWSDGIVTLRPNMTPHDVHTLRI